MSSYEPGLTLGRLVAAERNAATSLELCESNRKSLLLSNATVAKLAESVSELQRENTTLRGLLARLRGSGPTA